MKIFLLIMNNNNKDNILIRIFFFVLHTILTHGQKKLKGHIKCLRAITYLNASALVFNGGNFDSMFRIIRLSEIRANCLKLSLDEFSFGFSLASTNWKVLRHLKSIVRNLPHRVNEN